MPPQKKRNLSSSRMKKKHNITNQPAKDIKNHDIRQFMGEKTGFHLFGQGKKVEENMNIQNGNEEAKGTIEREKKLTEKQVLLTDERQKYHIPREKLGLFNEKPQNPEVFWKRLNQKEELEKEKKGNKKKGKGNSMKEKIVASNCPNQLKIESFVKNNVKKSNNL